MAQKNDWLDGLEGFARRDFAEKRARKALGMIEPRTSWFIHTLPNGRFVPVVIVRSDQVMNMRYLAEQGLALLN